MDGHESDPVQLYLAQMGNVPLFSRDEELRVARRIEKTRYRFRHSLLATDDPNPKVLTELGITEPRR